MAREDEIETAAPAPSLMGLGGKLAAVLDARAERFIAETAANGEIDKTLRTLTLIARAGLAVQALRAAEERAIDWAAERAIDRAARRAAAVVRAKAYQDIHDEGDETEMHGRDPRLDTPQGVAEIYQEAHRRVGEVFRHLETKRGDPGPDAGRRVEPDAELDIHGQPPPTAP